MTETASLCSLVSPLPSRHSTPDKSRIQDQDSIPSVITKTTETARLNNPTSTARDSTAQTYLAEQSIINSTYIMLPDAISKIIDPLPYSIKIFLCVMLGLQTVAVVAWMIMMGREISRKESKEKQS